MAMDANRDFTEIGVPALKALVAQLPDDGSVALGNIPGMLLWLAPDARIRGLVDLRNECLDDWETYP